MDYSKKYPKLFKGISSEDKNILVQSMASSYLDGADFTEASVKRLIDHYKGNITHEEFLKESLSEAKSNV